MTRCRWEATLNFTLELQLTIAGIANAALFRRSAEFAVFTSENNPTSPPSSHAHLVGAISLAIWTGVLACACLNVEAAPEVLLR